MAASKASLTVIQGGIIDAVPPPADLPESQVTDWNTITSTLAARKMLDDAALLNVRGYCAALENIRICSDELAKHGRFIKNKDGIPRAHPALSVLQKQQELANRFATEFALTPASRDRRGFGGGESASKPDEGIGDFL